jgi:subtilisin family serine protease
MSKNNYETPSKTNLSLFAALARRKQPRRGGMGLTSPELFGPTDRPLYLAVEAKQGADLKGSLELFENERLEKLADRFFSARLYPANVGRLMGNEDVVIAHLKNTFEPHISAASEQIGLRQGPQPKRVVEQDGKGVLIGVVDTGFDLTHPTFWSKDKKMLRVVSLWDQTTDDEFATDELMDAIRSGRKPGADKHGHGTHVASVAGGSLHEGSEGIAPGAQFLLVKTNFIETDDAVSWIFEKAGSTPCVVNLSFGGHDGAHDGSHVDEKLHHLQVQTEGRAIVVAAGNDRLRKIHCGFDFHSGELHEIPFDIFRPASELPSLFFSGWNSVCDQFVVSLVAPDGTPFQMPVTGRQGPMSNGLAEIYLAGQTDPTSPGLHETRVEVRFSEQPDIGALYGWRLMIQAKEVRLGRFDGWITLSQQGAFRPGQLVDPYGTITIPATGAGCIAVASHTSASTWKCEEHPFERSDRQAVLGRFSRFSSLGPTRDGRWKPDISAPGEHIRGALARQSAYSKLGERTQPSKDLITLHGTSMAAPVVTGVVALLLEKNNKLRAGRIMEILAKSARRDDHTREAEWSPAYGFGKIDAGKALGLV